MADIQKPMRSLQKRSGMNCIKCRSANVQFAECGSTHGHELFKICLNCGREMVYKLKNKDEYEKIVFRKGTKWPVKNRYMKPETKS